MFAESIPLCLVPEVRAMRGRNYSLRSTLERTRRSRVCGRQLLLWDYFSAARDPSGIDGRNLT